jgi:hypothetical protein
MALSGFGEVAENVAFSGAPDALVREPVGKGTTSVVPPKASNDAGFSP